MFQERSRQEDEEERTPYNGGSCITLSFPIDVHLHTTYILLSTVVACDVKVAQIDRYST